MLFTSRNDAEKYRQRLKHSAEELDKPIRTEELLGRIRNKLDD